MESNDAVLKCMTCGATLDVPAVSDLIAEEAFWHRRHFHQELAELDFTTKLPSEPSASALTVSASHLPADQSRRLAEWDARIANLLTAA
jgi:hypothetical protein